MQVVSDRKEMIFKNDINYTDSSGNQITKSIYKIGLSHKNTDGSYSKGSMLCKFPKNTPELESQTLIYIKNAWLDFYFKEKEKENGEKFKETVPYIFINEFTTIDEAINNGRNDFNNMADSTPEVEENDPFKDFSNEVILNDDDLPF